MRARLDLHSRNTLKLGLFGANCSSGRAVTKVPERWSGSWPDSLRLAQMADDAGIEFMLPIGRWKGYGGDTDYQGSTLELVTWAAGLLAATRHLTVFATVHAPLIHPIIAAKQFVTADHIGAGRFGLNIVCGWSEDEFDMFGVTMREHATRYEYEQEWLDAIKRAWGAEDDFDVDGRFIRLKQVRAKPKPFGGSRPIIMNAAASPTGQAFAIRNCDALFSMTPKGRLEDSPRMCATSRRWRMRRVANWMFRLSASSPAARRATTPRDITATASSTMPTGRRWTTSWPCAASRGTNTQMTSRSVARTRRTAWAACRSSATPMMSPASWHASAPPVRAVSRYRS